MAVDVGGDSIGSTGIDENLITKFEK